MHKHKHICVCTHSYTASPPCIHPAVCLYIYIYIYTSECPSMCPSMSVLCPSMSGPLSGPSWSKLPPFGAHGQFNYIHPACQSSSQIISLSTFAPDSNSSKKIANFHLNTKSRDFDLSKSISWRFKTKMYWPSKAAAGVVSVRVLKVTSCYGSNSQGLKNKIQSTLICHILTKESILIVY
jgi:hypothetical protein